MSKTREELILQALTNLGVIAEGQSVSAQDVSKMDGILDPAMDELSAIDIYYVQDPGDIGPTGGAIENSAFLSLAAYVANAASAAFNLPSDVKMKALAEEAKATLKTISAPARTRRRLQLDPAVRIRRFGYYTGGTGW